MMRVKKNDKVQVLSGRDRGKLGTVIKVVPAEDKVLVTGVGMVTRHMKRRKQGDVAAIKQEESFLPMAKVMPVCTNCKKPSRINVKTVDSRRVRACARCEEVF